MGNQTDEFSFKTRKQSIQRFQNEQFDLLVIGGGITGAAVARDAVSRGLKVALVERKDFAYGTSSRSSKLIHGGLRYLQNLEFGLVFEALSERAHLLKTAPHMVKPLPFYLPVYRGDAHSSSILSLGLWLYDLLALFRTPSFHKRLSKEKLLKEIPFLKSQGLVAGFTYFDASMWDDVLAVETLRSACMGGAAVANYIEAVEPLWEANQVVGFRVRDREGLREQDSSFSLRAHRTVICTGPWTDQIGMKLNPTWRNWLSPSKGVHLVFDLKRIPVPGAMVMSHPKDGRVAFVVPRPDFGAGVVLVGTTDGPADQNPEHSTISRDDVEYLMNLLAKYFPDLKLTTADILSAYIGVRPLVENGGESDPKNPSGAQEESNSSTLLQKISREHQIERGPGGTVVVAGGKYTTHRKMAEEIVDTTLELWKQDFSKKQAPPLPAQIGPSQTLSPINLKVSEAAIQESLKEAKERDLKLSPQLLDRYGADALTITELDQAQPRLSTVADDPHGFPYLEAQLRYSIRNEMVMHLEDFYLRRVPLYLARKDHGLPWAEVLAKVWAAERGLESDRVQLELAQLKKEVELRSSWEKMSGT